ncbi:hypothetical protein XA68_13825 [Ophiocordyceps unilateralis]|uniref:Uncharacterized protein n=1 Tax=Ophiocordyceps unilateralis TaxID=268505 RepID=A0A2A9PNK3_OPHUN|nr:hypothetical protein XA68_13825 [Ophiocordyceps unilateralis]
MSTATDKPERHCLNPHFNFSEEPLQMSFFRILFLPFAVLGAALLSLTRASTSVDSMILLGGQQADVAFVPREESQASIDVDSGEEEVDEDQEAEEDDGIGEQVVEGHSALNTLFGRQAFFCLTSSLRGGKCDSSKCEGRTQCQLAAVIAIAGQCPIFVADASSGHG